ncbi:MAG TPA: FtsX-like permease family protein, partial [Gammaproteobacteria bacterium]|nr:FtsX-like permease family protein [Gammaproteobacteria bacterium]
LAEAGEPEEVFAALVSTSQFDVMGVRPVLGRGFVPEDGVAGADPVALLSHDVWVERFAADPDIIGRRIALGGEDAEYRTVVGIMPAGYLPAVGRGVAAWVPIIVDPTADDYGGHYFMRAVARLSPGVTPEGFNRELKAWAPRMSEVDPSWFIQERVARASALPLGRWTSRDRSTPVLLALAAALLVLLVGCANVTNLVLARTTGRERELSVRAALGAGRMRTARMVLAEGATLGTLGSILGFGLAIAVVRLLELRFPDALPDWGIALDFRWASAAVLLAACAVLGASLVPALLAARRDPARALAGGRAVAAHRHLGRTQEVLVAAQLGLAMAGVVAMGLLGRSLLGLAAMNPGFQPSHAVTFSVSVPPGAYSDAADVARFYREARAALVAVPGVQAAGFASRLPLSGGDSQANVRPQGMDLPDGRPTPVAWVRRITPGYVEALGAHLLEGRIPTDSEDRANAPELVLINRHAARTFWPGQSAIGKTFRGDTPMMVVGVVANIMEKGQRQPILPAIYEPARGKYRSMSAVVRTRDQPEDLLPELRDAIHSVSTGAPISRVTTLQEIADAGLRSTRILALLAAVAGFVTLLLAALGTYAVVSYAVSRRRREIAVRAAVGADRGRLLRGELATATRIIGSGLAGGLGLSWIAGAALRGTLFGVGSMDPVSIGAALAVLAGVGYLAAYMPARRAAAVDPASILRDA